MPIAPSENESAAGRDDAKRPPPSPMMQDYFWCREHFPKKTRSTAHLLLPHRCDVSLIALGHQLLGTH